MSLTREKLGATLLVCLYAALAEMCGAVYANAAGHLHFASRTERGVRFLAVSVLASVVVLLACWSAAQRKSTLSLGWAFAGLSIVGSAFAIGSRFNPHAWDQAVGIIFSVTVLFFVAYSYIMPLAAVFQWQLSGTGGCVLPRKERTFSISKMLVWTSSVAILLGLVTPLAFDQSVTVAILGLFIGVPSSLAVVLIVAFAAFDRTQYAKRLLQSVGWLLAITGGQCTFAISPIFNMWGYNSATLRFVWPPAGALLCINVTFFITTLISSLWMRSFGYCFVTIDDASRLPAAS